MKSTPRLTDLLEGAPVAAPDRGAAGALVLVPGGAGFVGSHLCDRLLARGHRVLALDDLSTGDERHVAHLAGNPAFALCRHDVTGALPASAEGATRIFNLACPASPAHY